MGCELCCASHCSEVYKSNSRFGKYVSLCILSFISRLGPVIEERAKWGKQKLASDSISRYVPGRELYIQLMMRRHRACTHRHSNPTKKLEAQTACDQLQAALEVKQLHHSKTLSLVAMAAAAAEKKYQWVVLLIYSHTPQALRLRR